MNRTMQRGLRLGTFAGECYLGTAIDGVGAEVIQGWEAHALLRGLLSDESERWVFRALLAELLPQRAPGADADDALLGEVLARIDAGHLVLFRRSEEQAFHAPWATEGERGEPEEGDAPAEARDHYIQIEVVDDEGLPVPSVAYELTLPNGRIMRGRTNQYGVIYASGINPGSCTLRLPDLDREAWEQA